MADGFNGWLMVDGKKPNCYTVVVWANPSPWH